MEELLGLPLDTGTGILKQKGIRFTLKEARCNKGTGGSDARIIAVREQADGSVEILYSLLVTDVRNDTSCKQ